MSYSMTLAALAIVHIIWGGGFIILKVLQQYLTLEHILLGRVLLASVLYLLLWKRIPKPQYRKGDWKVLLLLALCEPFLLFLFETLGLQYTSASQGGMIVACVPLTVALGAFLVYRERISMRCLAGIVLAVGGVIMVSALATASEQASNPLLGNLLIFCAVLSSTCYALSVKHLCTRYHYMYLAAVQVFGATVLFLPTAVMQPLPPVETLLSWEVAGALVYLGLGITFFVYFVINYALTRIKAALVIQFANMIPISTMVFAYIFLDERLTTMQYVGVAMVLVGVLIAGSAGSGEIDEENSKDAMPEEV
ncbi:DMT family transporter [Oleidesulfovibrio sp.]|uniref:DMT family transporter n=1 Tax=Oleidesulfovibrio sp. TaxID=2909707 RepID=UPI003A86072B